MTDLLTLYAEMMGGSLRPTILAFLRVASAMAVLPAFGEQSIPRRLRLAAALAFTAILLPVVSDRYVGEEVLLPALGETLSGLLIGLSLRLMVLGLQTAAAIMAQSASLSQLFPAAGAEPMPALGTLLTFASLALALQAGLHLKLISLFVLSYDLLPAGQVALGMDVATWGVAHVADAMGLALSLAAPFVAAALCWNIAMGVANRAMPHLMLSFIGAPALSLGALVLAALSVPLILSAWLSAFNDALTQPFSVP